MTSLWFHIVSMSITTTIIIVVVLFLRLLLKKAPRVISYALWLVVLFRLICPFSFHSDSSMVGNFSPALGTMPRSALSGDAYPSLEKSIPAVSLSAAPAIWAAGVLLVLVYGAVSYLRLNRRIATATRKEGNIYESDQIATPFVCGLIHPRIYLPLHLKEEDYLPVLLHEQTHIRRGDHWVKPLAYVVLAIHWFNPLVWLAFLLMSRDIETSCDESVLKHMSPSDKAQYSQSLLNLSVSGRRFGVSPLAFGEVNIKQRILKALYYKKPAVWVTVIALLVFSCSSFSCLADPIYSTGTYVPDYKTLVYQSDETDPETLARGIFNNYLNEYKRTDVRSKDRLKGYFVQIYDVKKSDNKLVFFVNYSVYPVDMDSWIPGNGEDYLFWVANKNTRVRAVQEGNTYRIKDMGLG